jgi:hypothetical protein
LFGGISKERLEYRGLKERLRILDLLDNRGLKENRENNGFKGML